MGNEDKGSLIYYELCMGRWKALKLFKNTYVHHEKALRIQWSSYEQIQTTCLLYVPVEWFHGLKEIHERDSLGTPNN